MGSPTAAAAVVIAHYLESLLPIVTLLPTVVVHIESFGVSWSLSTTLPKICVYLLPVLQKQLETV